MDKLVQQVNDIQLVKEYQVSPPIIKLNTHKKVDYAIVNMSKLIDLDETNDDRTMFES